MIGFAHQQYGNPNFAIQQLRNQNQMTTDQMNNYRVVLDAMTKEKEKNQAAIKELKHQLKDAKAQHDQSKLDLDIAQDQASRIETLQRQREHFLDNLQSLNQQVLKENGNGEVIQQMRELQDEKNKLRAVSKHPSREWNQGEQNCRWSQECQGWDQDLGE